MPFLYNPFSSHLTPQQSPRQIRLNSYIKVSIMSRRSTAKMCPIERMPARMLKEFLRDDDSFSSSSSGFKSFPRRISDHSNFARNCCEPPPATLPRSRSRSRAAVSSIQKLLQRSLHQISLSYSPSSPPSTLPRSFSKKVLMRGFRWPLKKPRRREGKVKVKDILRWTSFRDLAEVKEEAQPLDFVGPTSSSNSSEGSRWGDDDCSFTAEDLPCGWGHGNSADGKRWDQRAGMDGGDQLPGKIDASDSAQVGPKDRMASEDDKEQRSPVSILDSPFRDETLEPELVTSSFNQSLANMERTKQRLMQSIQWFESLAGLDDQLSLVEEEEEEDTETEELLEAAEERKEGNGLINENGRNRGLCWVKKGRKQGLKDKEECVKDMERQRQWSYKFWEEREELGVELEVDLLHDLVDDLLVDLFG